MRLLPQSLFGRLVWILVIGLIIAQFLSVIMREEDREEFFYQTRTIETARRISDIVAVLNALKPEDRASVVSSLSAFSVLVSKVEPGPPAPVPASATAENNAARSFEEVLRHFLGKRWPVGVVPYQKTVNGTIFMIKVRLEDNSWISLKSYLANDVNTSLNALFPKLIILLVSVLLLSLIAVRWVTRPLQTMALAAEALGKDINHPPLVVKGPQEVRRAAQAFNTMQARLAGYIRERTRILAAVSHDLKTPITRLRLRVEVLDDPVLKAKFIKDLEELEDMVSATLDFIHGLGTEERAQWIDINALLESLQSDAREMGREVTIQGTTTAPFLGNPQALKRCLSNIIDNAVTYGRRAALIVEDSDIRLQISVHDAGSGIPEKEMERVFDPFYRLEQSRNRASGGTGLGLTIARNIARSHGGELSLRNLPGGGLEAVLTLPRRDRVD
jgi:signal transduction histidine kinase